MSSSEAQKELNAAIHANLGYERREEGDPYSPVELLGRCAGSCRDFAVLLAEVLRGVGIATRLASGYLCEFGGGDKIAEALSMPGRKPASWLRADSAWSDQWHLLRPPPSDCRSRNPARAHSVDERFEIRSGCQMCRRHMQARVRRAVVLKFLITVRRDSTSLHWAMNKVRVLPGLRFRRGDH